MSLLLLVEHWASRNSQDWPRETANHRILLLLSVAAWTAKVFFLFETRQALNYLTQT
jgi:hypothetical protein